VRQLNGGESLLPDVRIPASGRVIEKSASELTSDGNYESRRLSSRVARKTEAELFSPICKQAGCITNRHELSRLMSDFHDKPEN
jgi:hypothetical protein